MDADRIEARYGGAPGPEHSYADQPRNPGSQGALPQSSAPDLSAAAEGAQQGYLGNMDGGKD